MSPDFAAGRPMRPGPFPTDPGLRSAQLHQLRDRDRLKPLSLKT
jgi:hypothetical protein